MKNTFAITFVILTLLSSALLFTGCSRPEYVQQREQCEKEGWQYYETVGKESSDGKFMQWMSSSTASRLGVGVTIDGNETQKSYPQQEYLYKSCLFLKNSGDSFALVFRKEKTKP